MKIAVCNSIYVLGNFSTIVSLPKLKKKLTNFPKREIWIYGSIIFIFILLSFKRIISHSSRQYIMSFFKFHISHLRKSQHQRERMIKKSVSGRGMFFEKGCINVFQSEQVKNYSYFSQAPRDVFIKGRMKIDMFRSWAFKKKKSPSENFFEFSAAGGMKIIFWAYQYWDVPQVIIKKNILFRKKNFPHSRG